MNIERITRVTLEEAKLMKDQSDWARVRAEAAAGIEPERDEVGVDWSTARRVDPRTKTAVSIRLDSDVLAFFKAQGKGYQTRVNAVLRAYKSAQESAVKRG